MKFDYNKLRGRIVEKYSTLSNFAAAVGLTQTTVSQKMNGHYGFSQKDIVVWCGLLDIDIAEAPLYFLASSSNQ